MFKIGEADQEQQNTRPAFEMEDVFGGFDKDDPDVNADQERLSTNPSSRSRLSSRTSLSSLARIASTTSLVSFYLGSSSNRSSMESLNRDYNLETSTNLSHLFGVRLPPPKLEECHTCRVRWDQGQFSFDCLECGGYALDKSDCPECECNTTWQRDLQASHSKGRAVWKGGCRQTCNESLDHRRLPRLSSSLDGHQDNMLPISKTFNQLNLE